MRRFIILFFIMMLVVPAALAAEPDVIRYPRPLSENDTRFNYHTSLLREALDRTADEFGPYELQPTPIVMNQLRQFDMLQAGHASLDVAIKPTSVEREQSLTPVRIPLDKGLLGWRILLIHRNNQVTCSRIRDLNGLKAFHIGQGLGWSDIRILRHNGLMVTEGGKYEGLFGMLLADRFQIFPRGVGEAIAEWDSRHEDMPDLHVEETLLLHYPFARYFWTANTARGRKLNERITKGLEAMIHDGSFDARFNAQYGDIIRRARLGERTLIRLENPDLPPATPLHREALWFNPFAE